MGRLYTHIYIYIYFCLHDYAIKVNHPWIGKYDATLGPSCVLKGSRIKNTRILDFGEYFGVASGFSALIKILESFTLPETNGSRP